MGQRLIITEEERSRINKMYGLMNESAESLVDTAKKQMDSGEEPEQDIMDKIISCIKNQNLVHLRVLTVGSGAYILGVLALMLSSGVGTPLSLMASGVAILLADGLGLVGSDDITDEIESLLKCMGF